MSTNYEYKFRTVNEKTVFFGTGINGVITDGPWEEYHPGFILKRKDNYVNNRKQGLSEKFWPNGKSKVEGVHSWQISSQ